MDDLDRRLVSLIQDRFPLESRPFGDMAVKLCLDEDDVLSRLRRLKEKRILGSIRPRFDPEKWNYRSLLLAMRFSEEDVERAAACIGQHPGVFQSWHRNHYFNFWFTLALPSEESFEEHVRQLHWLSGASETRAFPVIKAYKEGPDLAQGVKKTKAGVFSENFPRRRKRRKLSVLTPREIRVIRRLQTGLPLVGSPYWALARELRMTENELLGILGSFYKRGVLKKISAELKLVPGGTSPAETHCLVLRVPEEKEDEIARKLIRLREITHCFKRPSFPEFPYSLHVNFCLKKPDEKDSFLRRMAEEVGPWHYWDLRNLKQYKKGPLWYFPPGLCEWSREAKARLKSKYVDLTQEGMEGPCLKGASSF